MSASLVGSEMCIRDSSMSVLGADGIGSALHLGSLSLCACRCDCGPLSHYGSLLAVADGRPARPCPSAAPGSGLHV
eukprot:10217278-Alexandrium_andersonii.AAC.1